MVQRCLSGAQRKRKHEKHRFELAYLVFGHLSFGDRINMKETVASVVAGAEISWLSEELDIRKMEKVLVFRDDSLSLQ